MQLKIIFENHQLTFILEENKQFVNEVSWQDNRDLLEKFLPTLDKLLKQSKIKIQDVDKITTKISGNESHSSYRILKAGEEVLTYSLKLLKSKVSN